MATVERTFTVIPPPPVVLAYLKDFANAEQWDPGTQQCTRIGSGPVDIGSRWHNVSKVAGVTTELTYRLDRATIDQLVFVGENDKATSTDTITVTPSGSGSEIRYHADIAMKGVARLVDPVIRLLFEKIANDTERQMVGVLNALTDEVPSAG
jgi:carbon monoxide dehydrogenase subunit G